MNKFYIADLHFGHKNCMSFDNREFKDIDTHDNEIIKRWNEKVGYEDEVYILGDVSWHNVTKTIEIFKQLNGVKILVIGNHDTKLLKNKDFRDLFVRIEHYLEIDDNGRFVVLSHYPIVAFNKHYYGAYHCFGHVHQGWENNMVNNFKYQMESLYDKPLNMYNVGCMLPYMDYTPRTLDEIIGAKL